MTKLFENISDKNIEKLKHFLKASTIKYQKNVNILSNVNQDNYIAIIDSGTVQLEYSDYNGNKIIIETLNQGDLLSTITYSIKGEEIECITKEETQITYIEYDDIVNDEIMKTDFYVVFTKNIIKLLSEQVNAKNKRIEILTKKTTRDKLLEYFRIISTEKGSKTFTIPITFTDLASYLSVDRSAMTREISYLKEEGFIKTNGKRITLLY